MGVLAVFWLFTFLSGAGFDALDIDLDFDADVDVDADVDIDGDVDADGDSDSDVSSEKEPGFFMKFLNFMNIGKVPFMLILSTLKFFMWVITLFTTSVVNVTGWGFMVTVNTNTSGNSRAVLHKTNNKPYGQIL